MANKKYRDVEEKIKGVHFDIYDLEGNIEEVLSKLEKIKAKATVDGYHKIEICHHYEFSHGDCERNSQFTIHGVRSETDKERNKRLAIREKEIENEKDRKVRIAEQERKLYEKLKKKFEKKEAKKKAKKKIGPPREKPKPKKRPKIRIGPIKRGEKKVPVSRGGD